MSDPTPPRTHAPDAPPSPGYTLPPMIGEGAPPCRSCGVPTDYGLCDCITGPTYADAVQGPLATGHGVRR